MKNDFFQKCNDALIYKSNTKEIKKQREKQLLRQRYNKLKGPERYKATTQTSINMSSDSLFAQIMAPGGGILLVPFTRGIMVCLFILTVTIFIFGIARVHMAILSFLSLGLWITLGVFQKEYGKVMQGKAEGGTPSTITKKRRPAVNSSKRED